MRMRRSIEVVLELLVAVGHAHVGVRRPFDVAVRHDRHARAFQGRPRGEGDRALRRELTAVHDKLRREAHAAHREELRAGA